MSDHNTGNAFDNYWADALAGVQEESGPGKPVIGRARIDLAYFAFASGYTGEDRQKCIFIPEPVKGGRDKAKAAAQKLCKDSGKSADEARWCVITTIYLEDAKYTDGGDVTWNNDQIDPVPLWPVWNKDGTRSESPSAGGLIWDTINDLKVKGGADFYAKLAWQADPYKVSQGDAGKTKESKAADDTVTMRYPTVIVVKEVYADRAAAQAAVAAGASAESTDDTGGAYPWADDWTADDLVAMVNTLTEKKGDYDTFAELVEDEAGEDAEFGIKLLAEVGEMDIADIAKFADWKPGVVRKALKS